ncbi:MAG: hypothetical protein HN368_18735, partial [Spirochaetales bacterium]|nr:hypothetical protein [Spirochaetales bacterium]
MKHFIHSSVKNSLFVLLLLTALSAFADPPFRSPEQVMEQWQSAMSRRDHEALSLCYWENATNVEIPPEGFRIFHHDLGEIIGFQIELFTSARGERGNLRFNLKEPERVMNTPNERPEFIYPAPGSYAFQSFQFEERRGEWKIDYQITLPRIYEFVEAGPAQKWADKNNNWVLEPEELATLFTVARSIGTEPQRANNPLLKQFDLDGNGFVDEGESHIGIRLFFQERLRLLYRYNPLLAEQFLDVDKNGEINFHEADSGVWMAIDGFHEGPRHIAEDPLHGRADFNNDGYLGLGEIFGYADLLYRTAATLPDLALRNPEDLRNWIDANGDDHISGSEINDLGIIIRDLLIQEETYSANPVTARFDRNRDMFVSAGEMGLVHELFLERILPGIISSFEGPDDWAEMLGRLDLNNNRRLDGEEIEQLMDLLRNIERKMGSSPD